MASMVKTVVLTGNWTKIDGLLGNNAIVKNLSAQTAYASIFEGRDAGDDDVVEIPPDGGEVLLSAYGKIYIKGIGKVQVTGTNSDTINFSVASTAMSGGGGGTSDVTKAYVDAQDTAILAAAKQYADDLDTTTVDDVKNALNSVFI